MKLLLLVVIVLLVLANPALTQRIGLAWHVLQPQVTESLENGCQAIHHQQ